MTALALDLPLVDERSARAELRRQIARLERRLAAHPVTGPAPAARPALPTLEELERTRDELAARVADAERAAGEQAAAQHRARLLLEDLRADPRANRHLAIPQHALGLPGCGVYRARPRLGLVGRLAGWWEITLSSGCPLPAPPAEPPLGAIP
jgi:hypothetical protein